LCRALTPPNPAHPPTHPLTACCRLRVHSVQELPQVTRRAAGADAAPLLLLLVLLVVLLVLLVVLLVVVLVVEVRRRCL
jgi:hypothetical protein